MESALAYEIEQLFGVPTSIELSRPDPQFGDLATNVALQLAKSLGRPPRQIAEEIATKLRDRGEFKDVSVAGPGFINFRLSDTALLASLARPIRRQRLNTKVVIETNNPNPFKAMHIGHAMNSIVADTIANLIEASGAQVNRVSYHGDVGAHVGKSIWAFLRYIDGDIAKLDHVLPGERNQLMSQMYAEGATAYSEDDQARIEIDELARQSFSRQDPLYQAVYQKIFDWSFAEIEQNVARLGNRPVIKRFLESQADARGVQTVRAHTPAVFEESDGALIFRGSEHGGFDNAFVASNGQGLYAARDLGLMQLKNDSFSPDKSYIVTAEEQRDYFKGVIAAAKLCLPELADQTVNISTGTVKLATGKMSSRTGAVITIDWLFDSLADAIKARGAEPAEAVIAGALRYAFLKVRIGSDIVFDINEAVSIQGNSGPYLQYAHARACSIMAKAESEVTNEMAGPFDQNERQLLVKLTEYQEVIERATAELLPHLICSYLYELAQEFNRFYEKSRIIGDPREAVRLGLVSQYRLVLHDGLELLGISALEKM